MGMVPSRRWRRLPVRVKLGGRRHWAPGWLWGNKAAGAQLSAVAADT